MDLLTLAATASFICVNPTHYDGDEIRCAGKQGSMKLFSVDAPRMKGDCRPGRACIPGDPIEARDYLTALTKRKKVECTLLGPNRHGSRDVRCLVEGVDLSCAMVNSGLAMEREYDLNCDAFKPAKPLNRFRAETRTLAALPSLWRWWIPLSLLAINAITYLAFVSDKKRARSGLNRISDIHLLALVLFGGGIGGLLAQARHDHMRTEQPFATQFAILLGLQFGTIVGLVGMLLWPLLSA